MADSGNSKNYGVPIYGAGWVPPSALRSAVEPPPATDDDKDDGVEKSSSSESYVVLAGGGGEGNSGIRNALIVAQFHFDSNVLSDEPVARLGTGGDLPYRMAVHPGGDGLICSLPKSCRWFDWDIQRAENRALGLKSSERVLEPLEDVGQQLALAFNNDGSLLAVGGEEGKLRVYKWPSMENILDQANAHASVKDLDFSPDGKFLASVGSGPCRIWDVSISTSVASLMKENDEIFGYCRFSPSNDENQVLYITTMQDQGGSISKWNTTTWKRIKSKRVVRDPICAFNLSPNGKLLAIGTIEGDVLIVSSNNLQVQNVVKKAHLGLVTTLKFSEDSRALLSASMDSRVRVTVIKEEKKSGLNLWIVILVLLIAIAVFYAASNGILPLELNSISK
ncbi:SEC12-like protein 2 [Capsicum annuum]|uniref:SEC12-like protein 2 n=1 Tax=Capsicum annuum TaxID=4072 RepID=UPI0007BEC615|nr:SEC12-like protein 2 [Capsicum annuum]KAF3626824.1 SEC12-like protein 2 [Capsicum annuum]